MMIIPAIDLMGGKCVRLVQGKREREIVYQQTLFELAEHYLRQGAKIIHVVDLDGAFSGTMGNFEAIRTLARHFPIQVGGGIRNSEKAEALLAAGVKKIILGTMLAKDPVLAAEVKEKYSSRIIGSFDFRGRKLCSFGWVDENPADFSELSKDFHEIIVTDVSKDGMLEGPNLDLLKYAKSRCASRIICAGGVTSLGDIEALKDLDIYGAIVGRSVLDGKLSLEEAIKCSQRE